MKPIRDTKLGQWLKEKAPKILDQVGDFLPDKGALGIIKNIIDRDDEISPEVKAEAAKMWHNYELELLKDVQSAREMNVALSQSDNAPPLVKLTASIIALAYTLFNFVIYVMILSGRFNVDNNMAILIVNSITNIAMLIVGFYFGSSYQRQQQMKVLKNDLRKAA